MPHRAREEYTLEATTEKTCLYMFASGKELQVKGKADRCQC